MAKKWGFMGYFNGNLSSNMFFWLNIFVQYGQSDPIWPNNEFISYLGCYCHKNGIKMDLN